MLILHRCIPYSRKGYKRLFIWISNGQLEWQLYDIVFRYEQYLRRL